MQFLKKNVKYVKIMALDKAFAIRVEKISEYVIIEKKEGNYE